MVILLLLSKGSAWHCYVLLVEMGTKYGILLDEISKFSCHLNVISPRDLAYISRYVARWVLLYMPRGMWDVPFGIRFFLSRRRRDVWVQLVERAKPSCYPWRISLCCSEFSFGGESLIRYIFLWLVAIIAMLRIPNAICNYVLFIIYSFVCMILLLWYAFVGFGCLFCVRNFIIWCGNVPE